MASGGYPSIVNETVSESVASTPVNLQSKGACISQGATTLTVGTYALVTSDDISSILAAPLALTSLTWSAGVAVATSSAALPGVAVGDTFITTIAGASPVGYNGTFLATVTGSDTFTYALTSNPGAETVPGTYTPNNQGELAAMFGTFFGQGGNQAGYILELGAGDGTSGPTALDTWITANPGIFYSYCVPLLWDSTSAYLALLAEYTSLTAKTYFFTFTTTSTYDNYAGLKDVVSFVQAPAAPLSEFDAAADFQHTLSYAPGGSNLMTPNAYSYMYDVTPYPAAGNAALLSSLVSGFTNFIGTGAEAGQPSNLILFKGTTQDGNDFSFWYSVDYMQLQGDQALAAAVIQGANNSLAPLQYNQSGIKTLQTVLAGVVSNAITYGLANGTLAFAGLSPAQFAANIEDGDYAGQCVVNAVPFATYTQLNPNDYANKVYNGLSVLYLVQEFFVNVGFSVVFTNLAGSQ